MTVAPHLPPFASVDQVSLQTACLAISKAVSPASAISYPGEPIYQQDISHYLNSSVQAAACTVEPGTTHDVAAILNVISTTRVPFGVKGGGHASNPGFSSTPGVLIAMRRFSRVEYDAVAGTAAIGAGLIWDDVYAALAPFGVNVVGGRVPGIGVAGFTLGGGFSWKTNQFGLTIDTVEAFELVKPSGVVVNVTKGTFPDLFFALKGGYNNFGIVTKFTLRTHPQGEVWGGTIVYLQTSLAAVSAATAKFSSTSTDPKAAIIVSSGYLEGQGRVDNVIVFYDGPNPPPGIFDDYLSIPAASTTVKTNNFGTFISEMTPDPGFPRGISAVASHNDYSPTLLNAIANETNFWGEKLASKSAIFLSYAIEPFLQSIFSHDNSTSGYPPDRSHRILPTNLVFSWTDPAFDSDMLAAARLSTNFLQSFAPDAGALYPNYAIFGTPLEKMYGQNVQRLRMIRAAADPQNIMGLAGGFKF